MRPAGAQRLKSLPESRLFLKYNNELSYWSCLSNCKFETKMLKDI